MKRIIKRFIFILIPVFSTFIFLACNTSNVSIVVENRENPVLTTAANELQKSLSFAFPKTNFYVSDKQEEKSGIVLKVDPELDTEEYLVTNKNNLAIISGGSDKGVLYGVYGMLEKLGYDYYISFDKKPKTGKFNYYDWQLTDKPLKENRIVFNWHNFISGCSGWDLADWKAWIEQSSKMRFNAIMVHAYGNNPMYSFSYNGQQKEVGYLSSTWSGRDWGNEHVNDIRNLTGGSLFDKPVFGCKESLVPDSVRIKAATLLMQNVFDHARKYGMNVIYAVDVDTWMSNPQNIISTLPGKAKYKVGDYELVDPDTEEGYKYYLALFRSIITTYPQVTNIVIWSRERTTPWTVITYNDFPKEWKTEYNEMISGNPVIINDSYSPSSFAQSKIAKAFIKANIETGAKLKLSFGSWNLAWMNSMNFFFDKKIAVLPLSFDVKFDAPEVQEILKSVGKDRELNPIIWAHHDDHTYIGRPYYPFKNWNTMLDQNNSRGFGIIHWTTRPLDIYFKSHVTQVWNNTLNEDPEISINKMAESIFETDSKELAGYLNLWHSEGPLFARETFDNFIDLPRSTKGVKPLSQGPERPVYGIQPDQVDSVISKVRERLSILNSINSKKLPEGGEKWLNYFKLNEEFYISFFRNHLQFVKAYGLLQNHQYNEARTEIEPTNPDETMELYQKAIRQLNPTIGEKGIVVSINLRWLPDYIDLKQQSGIAPILIKFAETRHDPLAQGPGKYSFFADSQKQLWVTLGNKELGTGIAGQSENWIKAVTESWLTFEGKSEILVRTMRNNQLKPGKYTVDIIYPENEKGTSINFMQNGNRSGTIKNDENKAILNVGEGDLKMIVNSKVRISGLIIKPE